LGTLFIASFYATAGAKII